MASSSGGLLAGSGGLLADSHAMSSGSGGLLAGSAESLSHAGAPAAAPPSAALSLAAPAATKVPPAGPGDRVLELHFVGELEWGEQFPGLSEDDGLFVDYEGLAGEDWLPIAKPEGFVGQTQTAYADADGVYVFNHPIDFHFFSTSIAGWPQLHLQVLKLDETGRVVAVSFGSMTLPCTPGHSELVCRTWTPKAGSCLDEAHAAYMGGPPGALLAARAEVLAAKLPEARTQMVTRTSGKVHVTVDTIFRNAKTHGLHLPR
uniref:B9 domain-containing protein 2 n=1 Tax=Alexandrium monilatum TaxID=311494 RepID=A0A7S4RP59_9DINO